MSIEGLDIDGYIIARYVIEKLEVDYQCLIYDLRERLKKGESFDDIKDEINKMCIKHKAKLDSLVKCNKISVGPGRYEYLDIKEARNDIEEILTTKDPYKLIKMQELGPFYYCDIFDMDILEVIYNSGYLFKYLLKKELKKYNDKQVLDDFEKIRDTTTYW